MDDTEAAVEETSALMSKAGLEAVLEELRRARGIDLSDYRRATLDGAWPCGCPRCV
jgi:hypothetical protein